MIVIFYDKILETFKFGIIFSQNQRHKNTYKVRYSVENDRGIINVYEGILRYQEIKL